MTVFRGKDWIQKARVQLQDWTAKVRRPRFDKIQQWVMGHKAAFAKTSGAFILLFVISAGGNQYIASNTYHVYHVLVDGNEIGVVNDPSVIEEAIEDKHKQLQLQNPDIHMVVNTEISFTSEKVFKGSYDNEAAVEQLEPHLVAQAVGVKLIVGDKVVAILKDREKANEVLEQFKAIYAVPQKKEMTVTVLSANADAGAENKEVKSIEFTEKVELEEVYIEPNQIIHPERVMDVLQTMGEPPQTYIVQSGDCISCIAQKFGITTADLYDLNDWIVDDMIHIGDEMIIRGFQPTLGVRVIEEAVEEEEIKFETVYEQDATLRLGKTKTLSSGKNGLKRVTYELTSINGQLIREELIHEEVLVEPVTAIVAKGTLRLAGEGTGKFSWPVASAKLTSSFGKRWGTQHKGIDLASSNRTIMASDTGKVTFAGTKNGYGKTVIIDHKNGYQTLYAHLSKISVKVGDVLEKGEQLGIMGSTGHSTGIHLHFEIHVDGTPENPIKYLNK